MNYEQFVSAMLLCAQMKLVNVATVEKQEVLRNNGVKAVGLSIRNHGENAAPIIYLEEYYQKYCLGGEIERLTEHLIERSREAIPAPVWEYENILDFQKIRHQIIYKLVNAKRNEPLLKDVPNLPVLDFAIVFQVVIPVDGMDLCSILIRNTHMDYWKLPISALYQRAKENTPRLCPCEFYSLSDYVEKKMEEEAAECPLYILSNEAKTNGAAVILYPEIPRKIYEYLEGNYYLLPSSVHEFLVLPEDAGYRPKELKEIVCDVNENHITAEEFLSDSIYYFDGKVITKM